MKDILVKIALQNIARSPLSAVKGFLRTWLLSSFMVSGAVSAYCVYGTWDQPHMLRDFLLGAPAVFILSLIPTLVILIVCWILFD